LSRQPLSDVLRALADRPRRPRPWQDGSKIPWHEPDFSQRVLAAHLDPASHMASRAPEVIAEHVSWLQELLSAEPMPSGRPRHLLDLGCGPGLYVPPMVQAGHHVTGIDFSPAAIDHARQSLGNTATFHEADLTALPGELLEQLTPVDVATFWFGEFNSFPPDQAQAMLTSVASTMPADSLLVLEYQPWDLFLRDDDTSWEAHTESVFSDEPHLRLEEHFWDEEARAEINVFWILESESGQIQRHTQCHQAYTDDELVEMLRVAGFEDPQFHPPITGVDERFEFPVIVARRTG